MRRGEDVERTQKRSNRRGPRHGGHQDVVLQTDAQFGRSIDDGQIFVKNREVELRYLIFSRHWLKFSLVRTRTTLLLLMVTRGMNPTTALA